MGECGGRGRANAASYHGEYAKLWGGQRAANDLGAILHFD